MVQIYHYYWVRWQNMLADIITESFFKTLKTELLYHHKFQTREQAKIQYLKTQKPSIIL
jgi:hypothetical protein